MGTNELQGFEDVESTLRSKRTLRSNLVEVDRVKLGSDEFANALSADFELSNLARDLFVRTPATGNDLLSGPNIGPKSIVVGEKLAVSVALCW
jgi:hypothetical protein